MNVLDVVIGALCAWRENRGGGSVGMKSILNVLQNRAVRDRTSIYQESVQRLQFSSMTAAGDAELTLWPALGDPQMATALEMAQRSVSGDLDDITGGATMYYAPKRLTGNTQTFIKPDGTLVPFPGPWKMSALKFRVEIANQLFFVEI